jgi:hypothetical protein
MMTNTAKHTPGPWYEDIHAEPEHMAKCLLDNPRWIAVEDTSDNGGHVAYCHPDNAPLIAAAPEMNEKIRWNVAKLSDFMDTLPPESKQWKEIQNIMMDLASALPKANNEERAEHAVTEYHNQPTE